MNMIDNAIESSNISNDIKFRSGTYLIEEFGHI